MFCSCYCCQSNSSCQVNYIGSIGLNEMCNSASCNQNQCFLYNATLCPAVGSTGVAQAVCSSAIMISAKYFLLIFAFVKNLLSRLI